MNFALMVMFCGLTIVFASLIVLVILFYLLGAGITKTEKKGKKAKTRVASTQAPAALQSDDDDNIIAVIAAAVASLYEGTGTAFTIKSIKRAQPADRSAWSRAGLANNTRAF